MKNLNKIIFALTIVFLLAACHKDSVDVKPENTEDSLVAPTAEEFHKVQNKALQNQIQKFSVNLDTLTGNAVKWISEKGTKVTISTGTLTKDGEPVHGIIDIQFIELYNAGQMLVTNKATMGKDKNGNIVPIVTGGAFYLNVLQNGTPIDPQTQISLTVPGKLTGGVDDDMILWRGDTDSVGNLTWVKIDGRQEKAAITPKDTTYYAVFGSFGWTNIDKFRSYDGPKTKLEIKVPDGFNFSNSVVYLKYVGEPNALAQLDKYKESEGLFTEHYGWIPIGEECHLIFASARSDGKWLIAIKDNLSIEANKTYKFTMSDTQIVDNDAAVIQMINDLP